MVAIYFNESWTRRVLLDYGGDTTHAVFGAHSPPVVVFVAEPRRLSAQAVAQAQPVTVLFQPRMEIAPKELP